jgi:hypothetical protein
VAAAVAAVGAAADPRQAAARTTEAIRIPEGRVRLEFNARNANVSGIRRRTARAKVRNVIVVG